MVVFVDYDGTITDLDTSDVLVRACAGPKLWGDLDGALEAGTLTLREVLAKQFSLVRLSLADADTLLARHTRVDPTFAPFVAACEARNVPIIILSSGIAPLIRRMLERAGLAHLCVLANDLESSPENGWHLRFRDASANGHDKAAAVRRARERGEETIFIGDGYSDFEAALIADRRYAKRNRALEVFLRERDVAFTSFDSFEHITRSLFNERKY